MTLSRRDRAAYVIAYECLRSGDLGEAGDALSCGVRSWNGNGFTERLMLACGTVPTDRLLHARLALYLRALLRADAGDCGKWHCPKCGSRWLVREDYDEEDGRRMWWCGKERLWRFYDDCDSVPVRSYRPLWERARRHGT